MPAPKGFTLIEFLLYIGISVMVLLSLSLFYSSILNARTRNQSMAEVDQQGSAVMTLLTQTVRNAESITLPVAGETDDALTLVVDDAGASPTVFTLTDGVLFLTEGTGDPTPLTNSLVTVTAFSVENLTRVGTPGNIRVSVSLSRRSDSVRREYHYEQTFEGSASLKR